MYMTPGKDGREALAGKKEARQEPPEESVNVTRSIACFICGSLSFRQDTRVLYSSIVA